MNDLRVETVPWVDLYPSSLAELNTMADITKKQVCLKNFYFKFLKHMLNKISSLSYS